MRARTRTVWSTWGLLALAVAIALLVKWPSLVAYLVQTRHVTRVPQPPEAVIAVATVFNANATRAKDAAASLLSERNGRAVRAVNELVFRTETRRLDAQLVSLSDELERLRGQVKELEKQRAVEAAAREVAARHAAEAARAAEDQSRKLIAASPPVAVRATVVPPAADDVPDSLAAGERILFVGDSLMQGVAPHIRRVLCGRQGAACTDLSKPSSGLSQRWFHDWPRAVAEAFQRDRYSILVVFMGANDPWDMVDGARRIAFHSEAWRETYAQRVRDIMRTARANGARVYWVGLPNMRGPRLQEGKSIQNGIFAEVADQEGGVFVPTHGVVDDGSAFFSRYLRLADGREIAVRGEDGVHFTITGQKLIADTVLANLRAGAAVVPQ